MAFSRLENWVDNLQASGRYAFLRKEAAVASGQSPEAAKKALQRMVARGRVVKAKDYFFVIVPLEYASSGGLPATWFIHDLMTAMNRPYYVGLLTAAGLHGASHQQPQEFQVLTNRPVRTITVGQVRVRFFASRYISRAAVMIVKTPTGSMTISTSETTAVDLVRFAKAAGQLDNVATVLAELVPKLNAKKLVASVKIVGDIPNAQRLGYILDRVRAGKLVIPLRRWIERQSPRPVPLRSHRRSQKVIEDRRWHVLVDHPLEIEV